MKHIPDDDAQAKDTTRVQRVQPRARGAAVPTTDDLLPSLADLDLTGRQSPRPGPSRHRPTPPPARSDSPAWSRPLLSPHSPRHTPPPRHTEATGRSPTPSSPAPLVIDEGASDIVSEDNFSDFEVLTQSTTEAAPVCPPPPRLSRAPPPRPKPRQPPRPKFARNEFPPPPSAPVINAVLHARGTSKPLQVRRDLIVGPLPETEEIGPIGIVDWRLRRQQARDRVARGKDHQRRLRIQADDAIEAAAAAAGLTSQERRPLSPAAAAAGLPPTKAQKKNPFTRRGGRGRTRAAFPSVAEIEHVEDPGKIKGNTRFQNARDRSDDDRYRPNVFVRYILNTNGSLEVRHASVEEAIDVQISVGINPDDLSKSETVVARAPVNALRQFQEDEDEIIVIELTNAPPLTVADRQIIGGVIGTKHAEDHYNFLYRPAGTKTAVIWPPQLPIQGFPSVQERNYRRDNIWHHNLRYRLWLVTACSNEWHQAANRRHRRRALQNQEDRRRSFFTEADVDSNVCSRTPSPESRKILAHATPATVVSQTEVDRERATQARVQAAQQAHLTDRSFFYEPANRKIWVTTHIIPNGNRRNVYGCPFCAKQDHDLEMLRSHLRNFHVDTFPSSGAAVPSCHRVVRI